MIDEVVAVDENIAKCNHLTVTFDPGRSFRIDLGEALHRFADDLEIAFDRLPHDAVPVLIVERLALGDIADEGRGVANVVKQLGCLRLHRQAAASHSPPG